MAGNTFGTLFKLTSFGESHGVAIGGVIDGCPAGLNIDIDFIQKQLDRRKPGQSKITTQRKEQDQLTILSGVFNGKSTGAPIGFTISNNDQRSSDYKKIKDAYRPSHADYTYDSKYGFRDYRGGGRSSARETIARVVAGSVAQLLLQKHKINITAFVSQVGHVLLPLDLAHQQTFNTLKKQFKNIDKNIVRCPEPFVADQMIQLIESVRKQGDSVGGIITCIAEGLPAGLGEPVFDKLHADLGKAMLSINAVKGFEYGSGFSAALMLGSQHNDAFIQGKNVVKTNFSGGIQGGISNSAPVYFNVAFKPVATIMKEQETISSTGKKVKLKAEGRHDPCVVPRAVPIVEAMTALVIADHLLRSKASKI